MSEGIKLLIVDDSPNIRMMLKIRLGQDDRFDIVGMGANGVEAVDMTTALLPDIVLLDLGMPVMDGLEALPLIRAAHPEVRVAVLSGFPAKQVERQAVSLGADLYVEKGDPLTLLGDQLASLMEPASPQG
jgi:DNA-binding NarL/FixJ family response regulator